MGKNRLFTNIYSIPPKIVQLKDNREVILRMFSERDIEGIWENFNEVVADQIYLPVYNPVKNDWEKKAWYHDLIDAGNFCVVAEDRLKHNPTNVVGQCTIENIAWEAASHVGQLGIIIQKSFRNLGLGYEIICYAKNIARNQGKSKLILSTLATNLMGYHLYIKAGFSKIGRYTKQYKIKNEFVDEILMECFLEDERQ